MSMMIQTTNQSTTVSKMHRKDKNGNEIVVEPDRDEYSTPTSGQYRLRLNGISDSFEMVGKYGPQQKVRLEWFVVDGKRRYIGTVFTDLCTLPPTMGPGSNFGKYVIALRNGAPLEDNGNMNLLDLINLEMVAAVKQETKSTTQGLRTYSNVIADSAVPVDDDDEVDEPVAVAAPAKPKRGVFNVDDDDDE